MQFRNIVSWFMRLINCQMIGLVNIDICYETLILFASSPSRDEIPNYGSYFSMGIQYCFIVPFNSLSLCSFILEATVQRGHILRPYCGTHLFLNLISLSCAYYIGIYLSVFFLPLLTKTKDQMTLEVSAIKEEYPTYYYYGIIIYFPNNQ